MKKQENRPNFLPFLGNFARKTLVAVVFGGLLAVALPLTAMAQIDTGEVFDADPTRPVYQYHVLAPGTITFTAFANANGMVSGGVANPNGANIALAFTDLTTGIFTFADDISIKGQVEQGSDHSLIGFLSFSDGTAFGGSILGSKNVTVTATDGEALGVLFRNGDGTRQNIEGAVINFGNISVTAQNGDGFHSLDGAYGFSAGAVDADAKITLGTVSAHAAKANAAAGVEFRGDVLGELKITGLNVSAKEQAQGIVTEGNLGTATKLTNIGTINVKTTGTTGTETAVGINTSGFIFDPNLVNKANVNLTGNMIVQGENAYGIVSRGGGNITGSANIDVKANTGYAIGAVFRNADFDNETVQLGNITALAKGASGGAYGFSAGRDLAAGATIEGDISLGKVTAHSATALNGMAIGVQAAGVEFNRSITGKLSIEELDVKAVNFAHGITVSSGAPMINADLGSANDYASIGNITVETTGTAAGGVNDGAYGIFVDQGDAYISLGGTIEAIARHADGVAYGIGNGVVGGDVNIVLANNLTISGTTAGIATKKNLDIDLASKTLNVDGGVVVGEDLTVTGAGTANLGVATVSGNTTIGNIAGTDNTTVAFDKNNSQLGGNNTLYTGATLVLGEGEGVYAHLGTWTGADASLARGIFTEWGFNADNRIQATRASSAYMSDGFLAAFGMHNRFAAWHSVRDRMISGGGNRYVRPSYGYQTPRDSFGYQAPQQYNTYRGQSSCSCSACESVIDYGCSPCDPVMVNPCDPCGTFGSPAMRHGIGHSIARNAWVNYVGRSDAYRSSYELNDRNWKFKSDGVQAGSDLFRTPFGQLGMLFGYENGKTTNAANRVKMDDINFGFYAAKVLAGGADIRGVFAYGWQDYDMRRLGLMNGIYSSSFKGNTMEGNLELGKRFSAGAWSLRPVFAADVLNNKIRSATEKSAGLMSGDFDEGVLYNRLNLTQVFLRTGAELRYQVRYFTFNSGIYYAYDVNGKELTTRVRSVNHQELYAPLVGTKLGRELWTFNVGGEYWLSHNVSVFGGYQGECITDRADSKVHNTGYVGAGWRW